MSDGDKNETKIPQIRAVSAPIPVPVYNVILYVSRGQDGVTARVANLPDLTFAASSEPLVLKKAITEVKSRLTTWHQDGTVIPWIDPVPESEPGEEQRLVPVHL